MNNESRDRPDGYQQAIEDAAKVLCGFCEKGNPVEYIAEAGTFKHHLEGETPWRTCHAYKIRALVPPEQEK